jgi:hypothetical protein
MGDTEPLHELLLHPPPPPPPDIIIALVLVLLLFWNFGISMVSLLLTLLNPFVVLLVVLFCFGVQMGAEALSPLLLWEPPPGARQAFSPFAAACIFTTTIFSYSSYSPSPL